MSSKSPADVSAARLTTWWLGANSFRLRSPEPDTRDRPLVAGTVSSWACQEAASQHILARRRSIELRLALLNRRAHLGGPSTRWETIMGTAAIATHREPWNKGKIVGQKAPFKLRDIWALRVRLQMETGAGARPVRPSESTASCEDATSSVSGRATSATAA